MLRSSGYSLVVEKPVLLALMADLSVTLCWRPLQLIILGSNMALIINCNTVSLVTADFAAIKTTTAETTSLIQPDHFLKPFLNRIILYYLVNVEDLA